MIFCLKNHEFQEEILLQKWLWKNWSTCLTQSQMGKFFALPPTSVMVWFNVSKYDNVPRCKFQKTRLDKERTKLNL